MKTYTYLSAFVDCIPLPLTGEAKRKRQRTKFLTALIRRIEAGDRAREALRNMDPAVHLIYCPFCDEEMPTHAPDCKRQFALGIEP